MFKNAGPAEIIRSHQKDDFYLVYLRGLAADVIHHFIGPRAWIQWRKEVDVLADLGYFCLTTMSGYQTIGEEYVNIVQVDQSKRQIPSVTSRCVMVLLHVLAPYGLRKLLDWLEKKLKSDNVQEVPIETREFLLKCIPIARTLVLYSHRVHMAVFYLKGVFYYVAKRFANVHYIQHDFGMLKGDDSISQSFQVLGWLTVAQLVGSGILAGYKLIKDKSKQLTNSKLQESTSSVGFVSPDRKCSLCLEERKHSSATPCGHLFCWTCIHDWCSSKSECPLCREKFDQHRIVYLQNLDPP